MKPPILKKANEILALFAYWNLTPAQSLEVIKLARKKIENQKLKGNAIKKRIDYGN